MVVISLKVPVIILTRIENMTPNQQSTTQTNSATTESTSLKSKSENGPALECALCSRVYKSRSGLRRHVKKIHQTDLSCHHCHRHFLIMSDLQNHLNSAHNTEAETKNALKCQMCTKNCSNPSALQRHIQTHTKEKYLACKYCDKKFPSLWKLTRHAVSLHLNVKRRSSGPQFKYECCGNGFTTTEELEKHQVVHKPTSLPAFECQVCVKRFARKDHLKRHIRIHLGEKAFDCLNCKKSFASKSNLNRHVASCSAAAKVNVPKEEVEKRPKPAPVLSFKCEYCEKAYPNSFQLVSHTRTHTGEKPFPCPTERCNQRFSQQRSLAVHLKVHARLMACTCQFCELVCKTEADCKEHEKTHRGEGMKGFQCTLCNATFHRRKSLKFHSISHKKVRNVFNPLQVLGL